MTDFTDDHTHGPSEPPGTPGDAATPAGGSPPCYLTEVDPAYSGLSDPDRPPLRDAAGTPLATDAEGYLVEPETWDRDVAAQLAASEGLTLQDEHWPVLEFMRRYYAEHQIAADARHVIRYMGEELGLGHAAHKRLYELFPYGYVQQACKIAGMKRPRAWNTG
jgi:tRNA 2-thiouridine synthesizing protein E